MMTFWPRLATCASTCALAPLPMPSMAMIVPTPMMMPSAVRPERNLFRRRARKAIFTVATMALMSVFLLCASKQTAQRHGLALGGFHSDDDLLAFVQSFEHLSHTAIADANLDRRLLWAGFGQIGISDG